MKLKVIVKPHLKLTKENETKKYGEVFEVSEERGIEILKTVFNGATIFSSSTNLLGINTSASSSPCDVSTTTLSPFLTLNPFGLKKYILPNFLNLIPIIFFNYCCFYFFS